MDMVTRLKKKPISSLVSVLKVGGFCKVTGHPYGVVRTSIWRLGRKYPKRKYQCRNIGGIAWVFRIK